MKECKQCGSKDVVEKLQFELFNPETDENEVVDGYLCLNCGCFTEKDGLFF